MICQPTSPHNYIIDFDKALEGEEKEIKTCNFLVKWLDYKMIFKKWFATYPLLFRETYIGLEENLPMVDNWLTYHWTLIKLHVNSNFAEEVNKGQCQYQMKRTK